jgi:hemerythrin-like domain-containing protein
MSKNPNWLMHDHCKYDQELEDCEIALEENDWKTAVKLFNTFVKGFKLHMLMEDEVLYPLVDKESGDPNGDLVLLSHEHDGLHRLLGDLVYVIKTKDFDHFEECLQFLHKAMDQHKDHEDAVFLSLGTESLLLRRDEIMSRLEAFRSKVTAPTTRWAKFFSFLPARNRCRAGTGICHAAHSRQTRSCYASRWDIT